MDFSLLTPAIAEIFLAGAAIVLVLVAAFGGEDSKASSLMRKLTIGSFVVAGALVVSNGQAPNLAFGNLFMTSPFKVYMKVLVLVAASVVLLMAKSHLKADGINRPEFSLLILMSVLGMMVLISANDLMVLYMGIELQSLPLYVIAAMRRDSIRSSEAGLKYFLLGALSSGLLLYGASLIYGFTGATNYGAIAAALAGGASNGAVIGIVFLVAGMAFKISAAPFHMWTPDVYEGSPTIVTAFFAVAPKLAAMTLFLRVTYGMLGQVGEAWQQVVVAIAVLSMIIGALGAIMQTDLKRLMAYSSIAHMGYALVGMASALPEGVSGVMVYMAIYVASALGIFAIILTLSRDGTSALKISDLAGYSRSHPLHAVCMMIFMFSMAGIPPLGGFFGKWFVFSAAVNAGMVSLAVFGVLSSVIGAFFYIRIIKVMYVDDAVGEVLDRHENSINTFVMTAMAIIVVLMMFGLSSLRDAIAATLPYIAFVVG
ncbi:MAG: NADH-quinone oxidoreductase subunit NuoN [Alphaproteobacteria bacterium]|nr:NADH-quinone oxidoreductase subunit NuoN [Alphaproteobacteria bacterium]